MIIWGGRTTSGKLDTGAYYNAIFDQWIPTSATNAPVARDSHSAVWTGTEMIIWGGRAPTYGTNTGARYTLSTDSWEALPTDGAPEGRRTHTGAVWTGTEMIVWGGTPNVCVRS